MKEDVDPASLAKQYMSATLNEIVQILQSQGKDMPEIMQILKTAFQQSLHDTLPQGDPSDWGQLPDSYEKWHT